MDVTSNQKQGPLYSAWHAQDVQADGEPCGYSVHVTPLNVPSDSSHVEWV